MSFNLKYRPQNLSEFVDQKDVIEQFSSLIKRWERGSKAILLYGPPGTGKTVLVEAFAKEKKYDLIEINASDYRSAKQIQEILGKSVKQASLTKRGKIFLIDEVDGLVGKEDFGGVNEIIQIIRGSFYPIVLTANDPWNPKLRALRNYCLMINFRKIPVWDLEKRLKYIARKEEVEFEEEVINKIAKNSSGDLRAAINDLEIISQGRSKISLETYEAIGFRERVYSIFEVMRNIFKSKSVLSSKLSINNSDKDPEEIFWWIENNIINEYENHEEIAKAFDYLSKADLFRNRMNSKQYWRFLVYFIDLTTAGVSLSKREVYKKFTRYQYPDRLIILGRSKETRTEKKELLENISKSFHCSSKKTRQEILPYLKIIMKSEKMREEILKSLDMTREDLRILK